MIRGFGGQLSLPQDKSLAAPDNGVAGKAPDPHPHSGEVAQGQQPDVAQDLAIAENADSDGKRDRNPGQQREAEQRQAFEGEAGAKDIEDGPGQSKGKDETDITQLAGVSDAASPAQLVREESAQVVGRDRSLDDFAAQAHSEARFGDLQAKLVVV